MALPCAPQQDLRRKAAVVTDTAIFKSGGGSVAVGGDHAGRSDTALGAFYRRLSSRIGKQKAVTATARKTAVIFYNTLRFGMPYRDPGAATYDERHRTRVLANLQRRARVLGYELAPASAATSVS
jgi:hypothetical protein